MSDVLPNSKPRMSYSELKPRVEAAGLTVAAHPLFVAGVRGYYSNSMGGPGNDSGIYDDAIFLVSPDHFSSYNANTNPSSERKGHGFGAAKGRARLQPGVWNVYQFDIHGGSVPHFALCQRGGAVRVMRDGNPNYPDQGRFGINIHRGGRLSTSSTGCQTIHPSQWDGFINAAVDQAKRFNGAKWRTTNVPYVLLV